MRRLLPAAILLTLIAFALCLAWRAYARKQLWAARTLEGFLIVFLGLILLSIWLPAAQAVRWLPPTRVQCVSNLLDLGHALKRYHADHGSFPPAFVADETGRPIMSWRTLLLPYLRLDGWPDPEEVYWSDEPWDDPHNLSRSIYELDFCCPRTCCRNQCRVSYCAVVGPETAWPGDRAARIPDDFPDGAEKTILVVEVSGIDSPWVEPRDLRFDDMSFRLNDVPGKSLSAVHQYVNVLFADGHVVSLPVDTPPETIRALLTAKGGEPIGKIEQR